VALFSEACFTLAIPNRTFAPEGEAPKLAEATPEELKEYVELISAPDHTKPEFDAFMAAWRESIYFSKESQLETMSTTQFRAIFERLIEG